MSSEVIAKKYAEKHALNEKQYKTLLELFAERTGWMRRDYKPTDTARIRTLPVINIDDYRIGGGLRRQTPTPGCIDLPKEQSPDA